MPAKCQRVCGNVDAAIRRAHKQGDRLMAHVNYDQPRGYGRHRIRTSLSSSRPSPGLSPSLPVRPCPCLRSAVRPCPFTVGAERQAPADGHSLAITHLARPIADTAAAGDGAAGYQSGRTLTDRQRVYRPATRCTSIETNLSIHAAAAWLAECRRGMSACPLSFDMAASR